MAINTDKALVLSPRRSAGTLPLWLARILALFCVIACLVLGLAGLLLPIIPGLFFLALAAMIAARHIPSLDRWLRKNRTMRSYLDSGQGFFSLHFLEKIRFVAWLCLKVCIDSLSLLFRVLFRLSTYRPKG